MLEFGVEGNYSSCYHHTTTNRVEAVLQQTENSREENRREFSGVMTYLDVHPFFLCFPCDNSLCHPVWICGLWVVGCDLWIRVQHFDWSNIFLRQSRMTEMSCMTYVCKHENSKLASCNKGTQYTSLRSHRTPVTRVSLRWIPCFFIKPHQLRPPAKEWQSHTRT